MVFITVFLILPLTHMTSGTFVIKEDRLESHNPMRAAKCIIPNGIPHTTRAVLFQQCLSRNYGQGNETRCYDELGCFTMDYPWTSLGRPFPTPLHPAEINVRIYCFTRESPKDHQIDLWPKIKLNKCQLIPTRITAFVVHGFATAGDAAWMARLKDIYLKQKNANVFLVDWGTGAQLLNYLQVASNTRIVGAELARFLKWLVTKGRVNPKSIHLMGHSLGSHVCAYAAKANPGVGRLTALDPAQPGFEAEDKMVRLDQDDADYVEVLHTNAAPFIPMLGFGLMFTYGHVDIYFNGGIRQPGCDLPQFTNITSISDLVWFPVEYIAALVACSHQRAYEYFTNVLQKDCTIWCKKANILTHAVNGLTMGFVDPLISPLKRCTAKTCLPLGFETPAYPARGVFAATTTTYHPYCETNPSVNRKFFKDLKKSMSKHGEFPFEIPIKFGLKKVERMESQLIGGEGADAVITDVIGKG